MELADFVHRVQRRANLATPPEALRAAQATLAVLAQAQPAAAERLAQHLPAELAQCLRGHAEDQGQGRGLNARYDLPEFYEEVGKREGSELPEAAWHARAVATVLCETLSPAGFAGLRAVLPEALGALFECDTEPIAA